MGLRPPCITWFCISSTSTARAASLPGGPLCSRGRSWWWPVVLVYESTCGVAAYARRQSDGAGAGGGRSVDSVNAAVPPEAPGFTTVPLRRPRGGLVFPTGTHAACMQPPFLLQSRVFWCARLIRMLHDSMCTVCLRPCSCLLRLSWVRVLTDSVCLAPCCKLHLQGRGRLLASLRVYGLVVVLAVRVHTCVVSG